MGEEDSVGVMYQRVGDWHVFTSDDVPELFVSHSDAECAYNDVAAVLDKLYLHNRGIECAFTPELTAEAFFGQEKQKGAQETDIAKVPAYLWQRHEPASHAV